MSVTPTSCPESPTPECDQNPPEFCLLHILLIILLILLLLGLLKALLGLCIAPIAICGLATIIPHPHEIRKYREPELKNKIPVYDDTGWPVHPDTGERTVRPLSCPAEFFTNLFFFFLYPLALLYKLFCYICCCRCFKLPRNDSCECFEWVNTIICTEDVEKRNLLSPDRGSEQQTKKSPSNISKTGRKTKRKPSRHTKSEPESSTTKTSMTKSTYDDTDQEQQDTKYVIDTLNKSKVSLKTDKK